MGIRPFKFATWIVWLAASYYCSAGEQIEPCPILASVPEQPHLFTGSDEQRHLVYELMVTNLLPKPVEISSITMSDAQTKTPLAVLSTSDVEQRMQIFGSREYARSLASGGSAVVFIHLLLHRLASVPQKLTHTISLAEAHNQEKTCHTVATTAIYNKAPVAIGPPLRGKGYIAADGCCDSSRHVRAFAPLNGNFKLAQRYAIDFEQMKHGTITNNPHSTQGYHIYGQNVLAVADGIVEQVIIGEPEQKPGAYPKGLSFGQYEGNAIILKLNKHHSVYALYAHLQSNSIRVKKGQRVRKGTVLAKVGNSGNTIAPHLHFQIMNGPSALNASGLPFVIDNFTLTANVSSTKDFDDAETSGQTLNLRKPQAAVLQLKTYPMDLSIVSF